MMTAAVAKKLDRLWKQKCRAESAAKINFEKYFELPELSLEKSKDGMVYLSREDRHALMLRLKAFRLLNRYRNIIEVCNDLGFSVKRSRLGEHELVNKS